MTPGTDPMPFRVTVMRGREQAVLRLEGELDYASVQELSDAVDHVLACNPSVIVVDAADLEFADVAGLRPLIDLAARLGPGTVQIRRAPRQIRRVLQLLDLDDLLA